jgi:hypothetical protein
MVVIAAGASWTAATIISSPALAGVMAFGAAWIALYPIARRNTAIPS